MTLLLGDSLEILKTLEGNSVQTCITSKSPSGGLNTQAKEPMKQSKNGWTFKVHLKKPNEELAMCRSQVSLYEKPKLTSDKTEVTCGVCLINYVNKTKK